MCVQTSWIAKPACLAHDVATMWRILICLVLLCAGNAACAQTDVASAQRSLLHLAVPQMETGVPPPVQAAIEALKRVLAEQTDAVLLRQTSNESAGQVRRALTAALPAERVGTHTNAELVAAANGDDSKPIAGMYGGGLHVAVTQPRPDLLLVTESFNIACGEDTLLLVYRTDAGHWRRILRWDSGQYDQISGAFGDAYETRILTPTLHGHPLLLVLHGTPWCTSVLSSFKMDLFELGPTEGRPVWHGSHGYRRDDDPALTLRTTADGFEVRTPVQSYLRDEKVSRTGTMRYAVRDGSIHRVEPIAQNARESLEEWLGMPREEAREFADGPAGGLTWTMYDTLSWRGVKDAEIDKHWTAVYGPVRSCTDTSKHFQAEMETSRGYGDKLEHGTTYYVQMTEVPNGYRIHAVTAQPNRACTGPDLMAAR